MSTATNNQEQPGKPSDKANTLPLNFNIDDCYCLKEVAAKFNKTTRTILNWRNAGKLTGCKHERYVLFQKAYIDAAVELYKRLRFLPGGL